MGEILPPALLLDMDDTILADSAGATESWQRLCEEFSSRQPFSAETVLAAIDAYRTWYWSDAERHRMGRLDLDAARQHILEVALERLGMTQATLQPLAREMALRYADMRNERSQPLPGAIDALDALRARGVRLALLTNGAAIAQRRKIERHQLAPYFELVIVEGEFGIGKPEAQVYQHALATLQLRPNDAWMVGDNLEWDVAAPQRLGVKGVWIDLSGNGLPATSAVRPDRIIRSLTDLL